MTASGSEFVQTFLESVGRKQDVELYLRIFREIPKESFAVICAEPDVLRHAPGVILEALHFLTALELRPIVALGLFGDAGPSAESFAERLESAAVPCTPARIAAPEIVDLVRSRLRDGQLLVIDSRTVPRPRRTEALGALLAKLKTRKLVLLRWRGGLGPHRPGLIELSPGHHLVTHDSGISIINLTTDRDLLTQHQLLPNQERTLLRTVSELHQSFPALLTSITSPFHLIEELFTVKGAGTLVKTGSTIHRYDSYRALDLERLVRLISDTFGRRLKKRFVAQKPLHVYVEHHYRGAAVIHAGSGAAFLSKFAVSQLAQGEGIGRDLWEAVVRDHPALYWRARAGNPIGEWYARQCDGLQRFSDWHIYWRGVAPDVIPALIADARQRSIDFHS